MQKIKYLLFYSVKAYGGDFLMEQPVDKLRGFFQAFFMVDQDTWSGFLAGWPGLPGNIHHETWDRRLKFCLDLFFKMQNPVKAAMVLYSIKYTSQYGPGTLIRSLTPDFLFGSGPKVFKAEKLPDQLGDIEVKSEARKMMLEFVPTAGEHFVTKMDSVKEVVAEVEIREEVSAYPAPFNS